MNPLFYLLFLLESCLFASLIFSKYGGPLLLLHCQERFAPGAFLKEEILASVLCLQRAAFSLEMWAFGLGIFNMFCRYMLSSGGLVGRFPTGSVGIKDLHGGSLSGLDWGASDLLFPATFQSTSTVDRQQIRS